MSAPSRPVAHRRKVRRRLGAVVAVLSLAACRSGGSHSNGFDEAALRARIIAQSPGVSEDVIDATVDVVRNACQSGFRDAMPQLKAEDPSGYDLARSACPQKFTATTAPAG